MDDKFKIENSTRDDLDMIFDFYREATAYQKTRFHIIWPDFDRDMVIREIKEKRQWKLLKGKQVIAVWATTFSDPDIWGNLDTDPAVYIHRIAVHPERRGQNTVAQIVAWARNYAKIHQKRFVRLDTVGENPKLIAHYTKNGFDFLGLFDPLVTDSLPEHYREDKVSLFQIDLEKPRV